MMRRLYRSDENRMVSGVLGGLGEYFNIDPTIFRLLFVAGLFFSGGTLIIIYIIAMIIIPNKWDTR